LGVPFMVIYLGAAWEPGHNKGSGSLP